MNKETIIIKGDESSLRAIQEELDKSEHSSELSTQISHQTKKGLRNTSARRQDPVSVLLISLATAALYDAIKLLARKLAEKYNAKVLDKTSKEDG